MKSAEGCVICGRTLKTGRKYCHIHRSLSREGNGRRVDPLALLVKQLFLGIYFVFEKALLAIYWLISYTFSKIRSEYKRRKELRKF
ncbi:MAG: hypothetical protein WC595_02490 [Candidatus Nanoarchaeia archaeon]